MIHTAPVVEVKQKDLKKIAQDPAASAKAVRLVYVNANSEGIVRKRAGTGFTYQYKGKVVRDKETLARIKSLVIPPAWEEVWICASANGHLQATGKDVLGRKQYRYHPLWNELRSKTKFYRLLELGKVLPQVRKKVQHDLSLPGLPKEKVLAVVVSLMEKTGIRTGNEFYEKLYGSFGVTTLKDQHASINGSTVKFCFRGKKGVEHTVSLKSKKLARIIQQCRDIPGKDLFQYIDEDGKRQTIESGMVNEYIREISEGGEFTAKDFRTWCGSVVALVTLKEMGCCENKTLATKKLNEMFDIVSQKLGNTRTVCKKYYVHPCLPELYGDGKLEKYIKQIRPSKKETIELASEEKVFMKILQSLS
jgi:DNA topoisomerase-1